MGGEVLFAFAAAGADVQFIVTGIRKGDGIGESAVHQAVLDAVDLLSLEKKVDAQQLAKAVVKLCRSVTPGATSGQPTVVGDNAQQFNAPVSNSGKYSGAKIGGVVEGDFKGKAKVQVGPRKPK